MWRPEDWSNPYIKDNDHIAVITDLQGTRNLMHNAYEAGSDAMLKRIVEWGKETCIGLDMSPLLRRECEHCWKELEKK